MTPDDFLSKEGLQYFATQLNAIIKRETNVNIANLIDETSTNAQIPGAKAVHDFVIAVFNACTGLRKEFVDELPEPADAVENVIYMVPIDEDTKRQWMIHNGVWIDFGTTEIDLTGYWKKEDLKAMSNTDIQEIIDEVWED